MRTIANLTRVTVTAPNNITHKGDNNIFTVVRKTSAAKDTYILRIALMGAAVTDYPATTNGDIIRWDMSDYLRTIAPGTRVPITIFEGSVSSPTGSWDASVTIYNGVALTSRYPGSEEVIMVVDGAKAELYLRGNCSLRGYGPDPLDPDKSDLVINEGECIYGVEPTGHDSALVDYATKRRYKFGEVWRSIETDRRLIRFIRPCGGRDMLLLQYINADGCVRFAEGVVASNTISASVTSYADNSGYIRSRAMHRVDAVGEDVSIGFANVDPSQYIEDIMLCDAVQVYGTDIVLVPDTLRVVRDGKVRDIVINFNMR